ncbi:MAG: hypothetical protein HYU02_01080 [Thaumarchaeota archaeon]|nr:hypothetical protein [Nitrososphaerota archaeon]
MLTTDIKDVFCDEILSDIGKFAKLVKALAPDYMTTLDSYTYYNIPAYISRVNILRTIIGAKEIADLNVKFVGLVLGSNLYQIREHIIALKKMGCNLFAYPCYELRRDGQHELLRARTSLVREYGGKLLALSCSPWRGRREILADYYSTHSWFPIRKGPQSYMKAGIEKLEAKLKASNRASAQGELQNGRGRLYYISLGTQG